MTIKEQIDQDLKAAMLAGDKTLVMTLRGLKSAILYVEVAKGARESGLPEDEVTGILQKEAKKRQESADLYAQGGNTEKQSAELAEKVVIEKYLPAQMTEEEIGLLVDKAISDMGVTGMQAMGQVIGKVKQEAGPAADGSVIAKIVKERLQ